MTNGKHIYEYTDAKGIAVIGDVHCHFEQLVYKCCLEYKLTDTLIIVAGDCGFGFFGTRYYVDIYKKLSKRLAECNNWVVFVRGNHDNPAYFDGQQVNYDRWRAMPDYSVLKACGRTILCVGGAISADRSWRLLKNLGRTVIEGEDETFLPDVYWPAERPVYDEAKLGAIDKQCTVDVVITHSAPSFCEKQSQGDIQNWLFKDKNLADDIKQEHMVMDDILGYLTAHSHPLQYWFYGHFHESWHGEIDGVQYNMLDVMEIRLLTDSGAQSLPPSEESKKRAARLAEIAARWSIF